MDHLLRNPAMGPGYSASSMLKSPGELSKVLRPESHPEIMPELAWVVASFCGFLKVLRCTYVHIRKTENHSFSCFLSLQWGTCRRLLVFLMGRLLPPVPRQLLPPSTLSVSRVNVQALLLALCPSTASFFSSVKMLEPASQVLARLSAGLVYVAHLSPFLLSSYLPVHGQACFSAQSNALGSR